MFWFKKVFFASLSFGLLAACSNSRGNRLQEWMKPSPEMKILSTTAQVGDLVSQVGGERIQNWVLIGGDLDPHSYELVKGDSEKFSRATLIFFNGLGLEHGASLSQLLQNEPKATSLGKWIALHHPEKILKRADVIDPHIWMDVSLWKQGIKPIVEALSQADPEGASYYRERGDILAAEMQREHEAIFEKLHQVPSAKRFLITSHDAFRYFVRAYLADPQEDWEKRFAAPEGLAPDGQLNPLDIQKIIDFLKEHRVSILFPESNVSRDSIRKIASAGKELGLHVKICPEPLYGDSTSGLSYLEMMRKNGDILARYLSSQG